MAEYSREAGSLFPNDPLNLDDFKDVDDSVKDIVMQYYSCTTRGDFDGAIAIMEENREVLAPYWIDAATLNLIKEELYNVSIYSFLLRETIVSYNEPTLTDLDINTYWIRPLYFFDGEHSAVTVGNVDDSYVYTGSAIQPVPVITCDGITTTLVADEDYILSYNDDCVNCGTKEIAITGRGYYRGTVTVEYEITQADIGNVKISDIDAQTYTGSEICPDIYAAYNGVVLAKGTDYTLSYSNNVSCGTAMVTVTGTGNYGSSTNLSFEIVPYQVTGLAVTDVTESTVSLSWIGGICTNYQLYRSSVSGNEGYGLIASPTDASYIDTGLASGTTYSYYVRACMDNDGTVSYGEWSNIVKAIPT